MNSIRLRTSIIVIALCMASPLFAEEKAPSSDTEPPLPLGIWGRPVDRGGFHFHASFGIGGGPDTLGLFHAMEIGGTFGNGLSLNLLHTFIQNKGIFAFDKSGPDLIGGWMAQVKYPLFYPDLEVKFATGIAGTQDQSDGIKLNGGWGISYGVDLHFPFFHTSGMTLNTSFLDVWAEGTHFFGAAVGLGYTFF